MRRGLLIGGVAASLVALAGLGAMPAQSAAACRGLPAPWVERQLRELPKIDSMPRGRFFGGRLEMWQAGAGDVIIEKAPVTYAFVSARPDQQLNLGWRVAIRLVRLGREKGRERSLAFRQRRIGKVGPREPQITVWVPDQPGIYRVDLFIRNRKGRFLRKISRYVIAAKRMLDVRMDTNRSSYSPGDEVRSEIENIGTRGITVVLPLLIQREVDGQWVSVAKGGSEGSGLLGGRIGGCASAHLPRNAPAGSYRGIRRVLIGIQPEYEFTLTLTAPFRVE